jgi:hypothetical protein
VVVSEFHAPTFATWGTVVTVRQRVMVLVDGAWVWRETEVHLSREDVVALKAASDEAVARYERRARERADRQALREALEAVLRAGLPASGGRR